MLRNFGIFLLVLATVCIFTACGPKEQAEETDAAEATQEEAEPQIVPGEMVLIPAGDFILVPRTKSISAITRQGR